MGLLPKWGLTTDERFGLVEKYGGSEFGGARVAFVGIRRIGFPENGSLIVTAGRFLVIDILSISEDFLNKDDEIESGEAMD